MGGLLVACAMCSGYPLMYACRRAWQAHYPTLTEQWANNGRFTLLGWFGTELCYEELAYAARANDTARHWPGYDPYIKENRGLRQLVIDRLTYIVMAAVIAVIGDINWSWIVIRFLCCCAWFILVYRLMMRVAESPPMALFCATFITCYSYILTFLFVANLSWDGSLPHIFAHNVWTVLSYGRTEAVIRLPRPGVTYALLFLATWGIIKAAESDTWRWAAWSGVMGGALAYVRFDVWSTYVVASCLYALARSVQDRRMRWRLWMSVVITSLVSLPLLYCIYPPDPDLLVRVVRPGRHFDLNSLVYFAAFVIGLRGRRNPTVLCFTCFAAAIFLMVNIELVTGFPLQSVHWKFIGNIYLFFLAVAFVPRILKCRTRPWLAASALLVLTAFSQSIAYAAIHYPFQGLPKDYDDALVWLNAHTPDNSVVLTINPEIDALIPVFTHNKVVLAYVIPWVSDYPLLQNCQRLVGGLRLLGADVARFIADCFTSPSSKYDRRSMLAMGLRRGEIEKEKEGLYELMLLSYMPESTARTLLSQAQNKPMDILPDYIWFGHLEREYAPGFPRSAKRWRLVYRNRALDIYERQDLLCAQDQKGDQARQARVAP